MRTERWQRLSAAFLRGYHRYATWLVGISWKRFVLLSIALLIVANIVPSLPPFSWRVTETIEDSTPRPPKVGPPTEPKPPTPERPREPVIKIERPASGAGKAEGVDISIDERGIRITPRARGAAPAASAASAAPAASVPGQVVITLPPGVAQDAVREAVEDVRLAIEDAAQAQRDTAEATRAATSPGGRIKRTRQVRWGDFLTDLAVLWVLASAIIKATYKGRMQAEVKAAQATEAAEAESLKRQVVEARMAAMQAQVEPHFLFNTLASIDHLIETDPQRASQMQKNLIALLRASMPTMREAAADGNAVRDLGRELQVIRPYLEILKVRMEERLSTRIDVPDGLLSAEFPPMMLQTLVENAIKHGLEPKPEGGRLEVRAEIVHGKLQVSVADSGLGFGRAATGGTGVGLANIRERLQLLHGPKATLTVAENPGGGTIVTITVPYRSLGDDAA
jgi:signal transduction histidine kinase